MNGTIRQTSRRSNENLFHDRETGPYSTCPVNYTSNNDINFKYRKLPFSCLHT